MELKRITKAFMVAVTVTLTPLALAQSTAGGTASSQVNAGASAGTDSSGTPLSPRKAMPAASKVPFAPAGPSRSAAITVLRDPVEFGVALRSPSPSIPEASQAAASSATQPAQINVIHAPPGTIVIPSGSTQSQIVGTQGIRHGNTVVIHSTSTVQPSAPQVVANPAPAVRVPDITASQAERTAYVGVIQAPPNDAPPGTRRALIGIPAQDSSAR